MESLQGHFLVASPFLPDSNFFRSVVLMIQHDMDGAFGVILNRPSTKTVRDIWELVTEQPCPCDEVVYLGGPVSGPLIGVHTDVTCSEDEIVPGVFLATRKENLIRLFRSQEASYRVFSGYAGWAAGQLDDELEVGGWLTAPATCEEIFSAPDCLWKKMSRHIGLDILAGTLRTRHVPDDPSVN